MKTTKSHELKAGVKKKKNKGEKLTQPEWDQKKHVMQSPILGLILSACDNLMREEPTQQASDPKKLTSLHPPILSPSLPLQVFTMPGPGIQSKPGLVTALVKLVV